MRWISLLMVAELKNNNYITLTHTNMNPTYSLCSSNHNNELFLILIFTIITYDVARDVGIPLNAPELSFFILEYCKSLNGITPYFQPIVFIYNVCIYHLIILSLSINILYVSFWIEIGNMYLKYEATKLKFRMLIMRVYCFVQWKLLFMAQILKPKFNFPNYGMCCL